ncbi:MAG: exosome complex RNA-binding protein Csl4 [Candidatus Ranarchaeia archaeon]
MTTSSYPRNGDPVLPGETLGVIEEFIPGVGTFEDNGNIYASVAGTVLINRKKCEISVNQRKRPMYAPHVGAIVEGLVTHVKAKVVLVDIHRSEEKEFPVPVIGMIHISNLSNRYTDKIDHAIAEDDYIKARVIRSECEPIQLTMAEPGLGVLYSLCRWCGGKLVQSHRDLVCTRCKRHDTRRTARDFNKGRLDRLKP